MSTVLPTFPVREATRELEKGRIETFRLQPRSVTEDIIAFDCDAPIMLGLGDEVLHEEMVAQFARFRAMNKPPKIIINMKDVTYIDSSGLGEIVRSYTAAKRQRGEIVFSNISKRVEDLLSITKLISDNKLTTVFHVFDSEEEAVAHLNLVAAPVAAPAAGMH